MAASVDVSAIIGWFKTRRLSKLGVVGLVALVLAGVSAHAAIRAIVDQQRQDQPQCTRADRL